MGAGSGPGGAGESVREGLLWVAEDVGRIVGTVRVSELGAPTRGTRWTNRQLLFHMVLGQNIARTSIPLFGAFSRLPPGASRVWSAGLEAFTGPYNWVNWAGAVVGARVMGVGSMGRMMDRTTRAIVRWYDRAGAEDLGRGMSVPPSWDPYFSDWMDRRDILEWAPEHYRHHRAQLTLSTLPD
jgi:hypothetical protein